MTIARARPAWCGSNRNEIVDGYTGTYVAGPRWAPFRVYAHAELVRPLADDTDHNSGDHITIASNDLHPLDVTVATKRRTCGRRVRDGDDKPTRDTLGRLQRAGPADPGGVTCTYNWDFDDGTTTTGSSGRSLQAHRLLPPAHRGGLQR